MLGRLYEDQVCSVARSLEVVGERWTLLVLRDVFFGIHRFDELQRSLGVARNVLQARLERLVEEGVLERRPYQRGRSEYHLTAKGRELWPALLALMSWGDRHYAGRKGPPRVIKHRDCGGKVDDRLDCRRCGQALKLPDVYWEWGPGAPKAVRAA